MSIQLLGVSFELVTKKMVLDVVQAALSSRENLRLVTVNPEYLLAGQGNERFQESLKKADLRLVDGFGIQLVSWLRGVHLSRVTGAELLPELLTLSEQQNIPVVIYNKSGGLSSEQDITLVLEKKYPHLQVHYNTELIEYSLVLCNYGAPEQELLLDTLETPSIKIGVGGALDYLTGKQSRAPLFLQNSGLEWLWRLIHQPKRLKRIWRAVVIFPLRALFSK